MNIYVLVIENRKTGEQLIVRSHGNTEVEAKEYARKFLNGNCKFNYIKCLGGHYDSA